MGPTYADPPVSGPTAGCRTAADPFPPQPALLLSGALRTPEKQKLLSAAGLVVDRAGRRGRMREYGRGHEEEGEEHEPQPGCGEGAGQAAPNCAAVCCCCPLALLDVLLLVTVKLPAGVMRRVRRRRRRHRDRVSRKKRSAAVEPASPSGSSGKAMIGAAPSPLEAEEEEARGEAAAAAAELEREIMSSRFYGAGFWRSVSSGSPPCATNSQPARPSPPRDFVAHIASRQARQIANNYLISS